MNFIQRENKYKLEAEYQGYTNYETWNVVLWISGEEPIYRDVVRKKPFTEESAEEFVKNHYPKGTPDLKSKGGAKAYDKVNWKEVVDAFNEL